ncbi:hypothetical protein QFZ77_004015 [Paenibacillus sp. V4I3]|nr:hypothetical protein [Paenibacillus sp. V4I3]MDQ0888700.1 hypothetical protein [Paenibacillus sp. V4I9]
MKFIKLFNLFKLNGFFFLDKTIDRLVERSRIDRVINFNDNDYQY